MKKVLLIIRLLIGATFGFFMAGLLLLPEIWRGMFPVAFILGFLGMPRRYHASSDLQRFNVSITLSGLLTATIILLIGALCFRDVFKIIRKLKVSHHES